MRIQSDDGLLALAGAIVRGTAAEAGGRVRLKHRGRPSADAKSAAVEAARRWFFERGGLFQVICEAMGRQPAEIRRKLRIA